MKLEVNQFGQNVPLNDRSLRTLAGLTLKYAGFYCIWLHRILARQERRPK